MHNVAMCRFYRDRESRTKAYSLGAADLLPPAKAMNEAHLQIHKKMAAAQNSARDDDGSSTGSKC